MKYSLPMMAALVAGDREDLADEERGARRASMQADRNESVEERLAWLDCA